MSEELNTEKCSVSSDRVIADGNQRESRPTLEVVFAVCVAISFLIADCLGLLMAAKLRLLVPYVIGSPFLLGLGCFLAIRTSQLGRAGALTLGILSFAVFAANLAFAANAMASM